MPVPPARSKISHGRGGESSSFSCCILKKISLSINNGDSPRIPPPSFDCETALLSFELNSVPMDKRRKPRSLGLAVDMREWMKAQTTC